MAKRVFILNAHGIIANETPIMLQHYGSSLGNQPVFPNVYLYTAIGACAHSDIKSIKSICLGHGTGLSARHPQGSEEYQAAIGGKKYTTSIPEVLLSGMMTFEEQELIEEPFGVIECIQEEFEMIWKVRFLFREWYAPGAKHSDDQQIEHQIIAENGTNITSERARANGCACLLSEVIDRIAQLVGSYDFDLHIASCLEFPEGYDGGGFFKGHEEEARTGRFFTGGKKKRKKKRKRKKKNKKTRRKNTRKRKKTRRRKKRRSKK
jgi:hypothetical protein